MLLFAHILFVIEYWLIISNICFCLCVYAFLVFQCQITCYFFYCLFFFMSYLYLGELLIIFFSTHFFFTPLYNFWRWKVLQTLIYAQVKPDILTIKGLWNSKMSGFHLFSVYKNQLFLSLFWLVFQMINYAYFWDLSWFCKFCIVKCNM